MYFMVAISEQAVDNGKGYGSIPGASYHYNSKRSLMHGMPDRICLKSSPEMIEKF